AKFLAVVPVNSDGGKDGRRPQIKEISEYLHDRDAEKRGQRESSDLERQRHHRRAKRKQGKRQDNRGSAGEFKRLRHGYSLDRRRARRPVWLVADFGTLFCGRKIFTQ